jgi:hypothetical protein
MRRIVIASCVVLAACGGAQIPTHAGYKSEKAKPWKKPKALAFDDKMETKAEGDLSYPDMRRARWFLLDVPANGELTLRLEITPPGDATNEDFDLGMEVLDPGYRVISKSDLEDEDAHELTKAKTLFDLHPGKYLIHLFLQGRMDTADFVLRATYKRTAAAEVKSDFPLHVAFVPALPMVPLNDDTPAKYKPPQTVVTKVIRKPKPPGSDKATPPPTSQLTARIIGLVVSGGGTLITVGRGTDSGAAQGMKGKIAGVSGGSFELATCSARTCTATVSATPDQIKAAGGNVVLTP